VIEIQVQDGWYVVKLPKCTLMLTREQFIDALKGGKEWRRRQALQPRRGARAPQEVSNASQ
jgi:hypothetical protein